MNKKFFIGAMMLLAAVTEASNAFAQTTYNQVGNSIYGSDGSSYNTVGNTTYDNHGNSWNKVGNTIYGSDGTTCNKVGNSLYCN
jgi:hypothetical protein